MQIATTETGRGYPWEPRWQRGFTLIELLVVIAVIGIMAALLLSALQSAKEKSRAVMCRSNMRQLSLAFNMYADENGDYYPWPGGEPDRANHNKYYEPDWCAGGQPATDLSSPERWNDASFGFHAEAGSLFPYVMSRKRMDYDEKFKEVYPVYRCPSTGRLGEALRVNYAANAWLDPGKPFGDSYVGKRGVLSTAVFNPVHKVLLVNEDPKRLCGAGFVPSSASAKGSPVPHLGKVNISFMDGHIEALSSDFVDDMQTKQVDRYYNLGK